MALEKTIYVGTFIHCATLTGLDIVVNGTIGVDEYGKIAFIHRDEEGRQVLSENGWDHAKIVKTKEHGFFFPGFIGVPTQRDDVHLALTSCRYAHTRVTVSQCRCLRQVDVVRLAKYVHIPTRVIF